MILLAAGETVVTAFANSAHGPGWGNQPVWVVIRCIDGVRLRELCLQPKEQTPEMHTLYRLSEAAHVAMSGAVDQMVRRQTAS